MAMLEVEGITVTDADRSKYDGCVRPEMKKFSIDPDLTTFQLLRDLLRTAFDIKCDFIISYLVPGTRGADDRYLPILSEWDLNTAIYAASDPVLTLKVDMKAGLDEWDIIEQDDILQTLECNDPTAMTSTCNGNVGENLTNNERTLTASVGHLLHKSWFGHGGGQNGKIVDTKICSKMKAEVVEKSKTKSPLTESQFRSYLDAEGRLLRPESFRLAVYQGGLESSLRHVVWKHLLNVYPPSLTDEERRTYVANLTEKYYLLRDIVLEKFKTGRISEELRLVANAVRKDVIRTDRTHNFFAGNEDENKNLMSLFNLLTTFALTHPEVSYCQGMSDLASPLLVVMQDEAEAYICFCALMRRMRRNFSCDGRSMTRKFHHMSELLQHYDPTFYDYLREMHADDLLFCYRWLLLELKREFSFDDALLLMEVMWASLPLSDGADPVSADDRTPLQLFDVDITACDEEFSSPTFDKCNFYGRIHSDIGQNSDGVHCTTTECESDGVFFRYPMEVEFSDHDDDDDSFEQKFSQSLNCYRPVSVSSTKSCPVNLATNACGVCHAAVVRSLMLQERESDRLHALRHASYPPKNNVSRCRVRHKRSQQPRFTIGAGPDEQLCDELAELVGPSAAKQSCSINSSHSVEHLSPNGYHTKELEESLDNNCCVRTTNGETREQTNCVVSRSSRDDIDVDSNNSLRIREKDPKRRHTMDERPVRHKKPTYNIRASIETAVADQDCGGQQQQRITPRRKQSPVPVARDASLEDCECLFKDTPNGFQLTLTEIHDICLMQTLTTQPPSVSDETNDSSANTNGGELRSRQPSGGADGVLVANNNTSSSNNIVNNATKSRHASSSANGGATNFDSGFSDTSNTAPYVSSADVTSRGGDSATENLLADVIEFANSAERADAKVTLPKPSEFGDGNPFMLFICLTLLLQHRDNIMKKRMDFNEIAIYFDKLMKKHNIRKVLKRARLLFADYLKSSFDNSYSSEKDAAVVDGSVVVCNT